jgi:YtkA-like protein
MDYADPVPPGPDGRAPWQPLCGNLSSLPGVKGMSRSTLVAAAALAAALIAPASTLAGGWATVGLSSLPDGARAGEEWVVDLTVLQHGRTPLEGVQPVVRIGRPDRGTERSFRAVPTGEAGVYRAKVVFPSTGEWSYSVDDDFSQVHQLGSVRIGSGSGETVVAPATPKPADPGDGVTLAGALGIALGAGLLAALLTTALRRRAQPKPAEG